MARIRSIKPEAFTSETLAKVSVNAERTFFGMSTIADDRGRLPDKPAQINGELWSMRGDHAVTELEAELQELVKADELVCRYVGCNGKRYLHLVTWDWHQKIDHPSKVRLPRCPHHPVSVTGKAEECGIHPGNCPVPRESLASPREPSRGANAGDASLASPAGGPGGAAVTSKDSTETGASADQQEPEFSRESREGSRGLATDLGPRTVDRGSVKTSRRAGKPAADGGQQSLPGAPPKTETAGQRVNRLTKTYTERVPLTSWQGARECVKRAVDAGVGDETITQALSKLADDGTSLTLASLRRAIYGPGQGQRGSGNGYQPWKNPADQSVYDEEMRPA